MSPGNGFTPLEALLLFQYLSNYGVSPTVFGKISDLLKNDEQVRRSGSYDAARLSAESLRDYYLKLLKDEARAELEGNDGTNGDSAQSGSRKRKAPSPTLPTIEEARKDARLVPQLIRKLYARYREDATVRIKADESRYLKLRQNIEEIQTGAWDERLQREIEGGRWDSIIKSKNRSEEKRLEVPVSNGAVKAPSPQPQDAARKSEQRQTAPSSQNATPALSPRPPQPSSTSQTPAISPRHTPQPAIQPAVGQQQPVYAQHPPISPRPPDAHPPSRQSQTPMPPPPHPSQTGSPFPPYNPYANNAPPQQLPPHSPYAPPSQPLPQGQAPPGQYQQHPPQQPPYPPHAGAPGGVVLQPFAVAPQTPSGPRQQGQTAPNMPNAQPTGRPSLQTQGVGFSPFDIAKLLATPITAKKLSLSAAPSPSPKDTQWKPLPGRATRGPRKSSPERPQSRSVSPISERAVSPPVEETARKTRRGKPLSAVPESVAGAPSRRARRARGGSTTSSVPASSVRGRTRSQSVISHAEDVSMVDTDSVAGGRHPRVKHEPSTPMDSSDMIRPTTEGTPNQTSRRLPPGKRKRGAREDSEMTDAEAVPLHPRQDKSIVLANRNFNRLSQTITNDIQSHKHASLFSNPVRDKDAEGYSDIIRRPQDLKSIRTAITAGTRAVNAAASASSETQSQGGHPVTLPVSEELVPPKAIVNPAQLEKEVMRMFANAVMFNPGDEGVVADAREMAKDVEGLLAKFREVERGGVVAAPVLSEVGTRVGSELEEEDGGVGKRRKVG